MRLGTRGSALALVQARWVADHLPGDVEIVEITTTGDGDRAARDKEKWVRELDRALLAGEIDLAVHSAKDVPGHLADGLVIAGVPPRAPAGDALCGADGLDALAPGAVVGTASVRRAAQLRALREDLRVTELRGNVDTRLRRLADGDTTGAARVLLRRKPIAATLAYAGSKLAVSRWCREHAVAAEWAGDGIRMNILAPGPVLTPLLRAQLAGGTGKQVRSFPVPAREYGTPEQIATWVLVMLSPAADFMVGSVITVDGGTEALLRPRAWPAPLPPAGVPRMLWSMARAAKRGQVADYSAVDSVPEPTGSTAAEGP